MYISDDFQKSGIIPKKIAGHVEIEKFKTQAFGIPEKLGVCKYNNIRFSPRVFSFLPSIKMRNTLNGCRDNF